LPNPRFVVDFSTEIQTLIDPDFEEDEWLVSMRWDASTESVLIYTSDTDRTRHTLKRFDIEERRTFDILEYDRFMPLLMSSQATYFYDRTPDITGNISVYGLYTDFARFAFYVPEIKLLETISNSGRYVGSHFWLIFDDPTGSDPDFRFYDHVDDQIISLNDVNREIRVIQPPRDPPIDFDWAPISDRIVYLDTDRRIVIYDFETRMRTIFADYPAKAVDMLTLEFDWSPDERYIAYAVDYGTNLFENFLIYILDTQTGQHIEVDAFNQFQERTVVWPGVLRWISEDTFVYVNFSGDLVRFNVTTRETVMLTNTPNILESRTNCALG